MEYNLALSDAAFDACTSACDTAAEALAGPARAAAPTVSGLTEMPARLAEFMSSLAVSCTVLTEAVEGVRAGASACRDSSDAIEHEVAGSLSALITVQASLASVGGGSR
ncbi:hypothetical protein ACXR2W_01545 [Leucobacter sp. HY1908]